MRIRIDGRHFTVTKDIKKLIRNRVDKFDKFLHNIVEVHFVLEIEKYRKIAEIILSAKNKIFKCKRITDDMYLSVDKALHNMERQLRQHKERVKHHQSKHSKSKEEIV